MFNSFKLSFVMKQIIRNVSLQTKCICLSVLMPRRNFYSARCINKNHYEILNVSRNCSSKQIREAFISLSKQYHPDKNKGNPKAQDQFVKLNEAYNVLIKPESRRNYDLELQYYDTPYPSKPSYSSKPPDPGYYYETNPYKDPWNDPSFAKNRNFNSQDDDYYYGVKGVKKITNKRLVIMIMIFTAVSIFGQIFLIRFSSVRNGDRLNYYSERNRQYLEFVKSRADSYGTRERQIEEVQRRAEQE